MKLKKEIIKKQIKEETMNLIEKYQNFDKVSIREIARECNISLGNFYTYYPSKKVLLMDLMKEHWDLFLVKLKTNLSAKTSFRELVIVLSINLENFLNLFSVIFLSNHKKLDDDFKTKSKKYHQEYNRELVVEINSFLKKIDVNLSDEDVLFLITAIIGNIKTKYLSISDFTKQIYKLYNIKGD